MCKIAGGCVSATRLCYWLCPGPYVRVLDVGGFRTFHPFAPPQEQEQEQEAERELMVQKGDGNYNVYAANSGLGLAYALKKDPQTFAGQWLGELFGMYSNSLVLTRDFAPGEEDHAEEIATLSGLHCEKSRAENKPPEDQEFLPPEDCKFLSQFAQLVIHGAYPLYAADRDRKRLPGDTDNVFLGDFKSVWKDGTACGKLHDSDGFQKEAVKNMASLYVSRTDVEDEDGMAVEMATTEQVEMPTRTTIIDKLTREEAILNDALRGDSRNWVDRGFSVPQERTEFEKILPFGVPERFVAPGGESGSSQSGSKPNTQLEPDANMFLTKDVACVKDADAQVQAGLSFQPSWDHVPFRDVLLMDVYPTKSQKGQSLLRRVLYPAATRLVQHVLTKIFGIEVNPKELKAIATIYDSLTVWHEFQGSSVEEDSRNNDARLVQLTLFVLFLKFKLSHPKVLAAEKAFADDSGDGWQESGWGRLTDIEGMVDYGKKRTTDPAAAAADIRKVEERFAYLRTKVPAPPKAGANDFSDLVAKFQAAAGSRDEPARDVNGVNKFGAPICPVGGNVPAEVRKVRIQKRGHAGPPHKHYTKRTTARGPTPWATTPLGSSPGRQRLPHGTNPSAPPFGSLPRLTH